MIYQGTVGANVALTDINATATLAADTALLNELEMTTNLYTSADCSGISAIVATGDDLSNYSGGADPNYGEDWGVTTAGDHRSYGFTIDFDNSADNSSQGGAITFDLTWTATQS